MGEYAHQNSDFSIAVGSNDPSLAARVRKKLEEQPIESLCIDFEDGFGRRSDDDEDREALRAAKELAEAPLTTRYGIRIKSFGFRDRALRTLDIFLDALGTPPPGFTVTLPKVTSPDEVAALSTRIPTIDLELMIETAAALRNPRALVDAGRVVALHLGAYDLTAELGVLASDQSLSHPYNDLARMTLKLHCPDVGISDGATTILPIGTPEEVHSAWKLHASNIRRAIAMGIWQGWDLHPAQLPARWGATFAAFRDAAPVMKARLDAFNAKAEQASRVGQVFDDAATIRAIRTFFERGRACGALEES
jgi:citrate lyase beta subunit